MNNNLKLTFIIIAFFFQASEVSAQNSCDAVLRDGVFNSTVSISQGKHAKSSKYASCEVGFDKTYRTYAEKNDTYDAACNMNYQRARSANRGSAFNNGRFCEMKFRDFQKEKKTTIDIFFKGFDLGFGSDEAKFDRWKSQYCGIFQSGNSFSKSQFNEWRSKNCRVNIDNQSMSRTDYDEWYQKECSDANYSESEGAFHYYAQKEASSKLLKSWQACKRADEGLSCWISPSAEGAKEIALLATFNSQRFELPKILQFYVPSAHAKIAKDARNLLKPDTVLRKGVTTQFLERTSLDQPFQISLTVSVDNDRISDSCNLVVPKQEVPNPQRSDNEQEYTPTEPASRPAPYTEPEQSCTAAQIQINTQCERSASSQCVNARDVDGALNGCYDSVLAACPNYNPC